MRITVRPYGNNYSINTDDETWFVETVEVNETEIDVEGPLYLYGEVQIAGAEANVREYAFIKTDGFLEDDVDVPNRYDDGGFRNYLYDEGETVEYWYGDQKWRGEIKNINSLGELEVVSEERADIISPNKVVNRSDA